jgi:acyl-CoA dehydrogenase
VVEAQDPASARDPVKLSASLGERLPLTRPAADEKAFADAIVQQLRADRLLWCMAPKDRGGDATGLGELARITFNIARLSGSAGLIYAMHMSQALSVLRHGGDEPFFTGFFERMVAKQALVASGTSEKGVGGDIYGSLCVIEEGPDGGLSLAKESPNISYLDHADAVLVSAVRLAPNGRKSQVLVAVEMGGLELQPGRGGDFIGMRGILNRPYAFTARFGEAAIFPQSYPVIARDTMTPTIHILWAALWSGIASHALAKASLFLAKEAPAEAATAELMRAELSRLVDKHYQMNGLVRDAIADYERPAATEAIGFLHTARIKRLKVVCSDLLQEICLGALGLIGIRAYGETGAYSLSEPLRDALSARVMISNYRLLASNAKIERFLQEGL